MRLKQKEKGNRIQQYLKIIWRIFFSKIIERHPTTDSQRFINAKQNIYSKTTLRFIIPKLLKAKDKEKTLKARHTGFKGTIRKLTASLSVETKKVKLSL